ncbi:hypothetical protein EMIT0158MI4_20599 [Burkholderia ambifaria]
MAIKANVSGLWFLWRMARRRGRGCRPLSEITGAREPANPSRKRRRKEAMGGDAAAGFFRALPRLNRGNAFHSACYDRRGIAVVDVVVPSGCATMRKPIRAR